MGHLSRRCIGTDALAVGIQGNTENFLESIFPVFLHFHG
jgi:hypothetical protein